MIDASLENAVGCSEDFLRRLLRDHIALKPVLNVASAAFSAAQAKRFTNEQRYCFCLDFSQAPWRLFGVADVGFHGVQQDNVGDFVKQSLVREFSKRRYSNLGFLRVSLNVSVCVCERNLLDAKCSKGALFIPFWNLGHWYRLAIGLCQYKPSWLPHESGNVEFVFACLAVSLLASKWHAKPDGLFAFADLSASVEPSFICINWPWLDTVTVALQKCR